MNLIPLDQLSFDSFKDLVNASFTVEASPERMVELELVEAGCNPDRPGSGNFSLIFTGPRTEFLTQKTYRFSHETIGSFDLFIVPIAADQGNVRYEVIFNRLTPAG